MKKYKTKPIDYTGCDPVIAEHLQRGEMIACHCFDASTGYRVPDQVKSFDVDNKHQYR